MNNTTTFNRSMFGLTEINANDINTDNIDANTINANQLTLSGTLKVNTITTTIADVNLNIDALGTGILNLKSGSVDKLTINNSTCSFYQSATLMNGNSLILNNATNTGSFSGSYSGGNFIMNIPSGFYSFRVNNVSRFTINNTQLTSVGPITAPTETAGSNNTRLATTAFVSTAFTNFLAGVNGWSGENTFNFALPTSTQTPTIATELTTKTYVDSVSGTSLLSSANTWTNTNTFNSFLPTSTLTPTTSTQLTTKAYVDSVGGSSLLSSSNVWTGSNTFNTILPTTSLTPSVSTHFTRKAYVDTQDAVTETNIRTASATFSGNNTHSGACTFSGANSFTNTNTFNTNLPTSTLTPTTATQLTTKTYVDSAISTSTTNLLASANTWTNTNTFNSFLPTSTLTATTATQFMNIQSLENYFYYRYNKVITIIDDFIESFTNNPFDWNNQGTGSTSSIAGIAGHVGMGRLSVGNVQNVGIVPTFATNVWYAQDIKVVEWVYRPSGSDVSHRIEAGVSTSYASQTVSAYVRLDLGLQFASYINGVSQNSVSFTIASGNWIYSRVTFTATTIIFYVLNTSTSATATYTYTGTISSASTIVPFFKFTNLNANAKTCDLDYFSISYQTNRT